MSLSEIAESFSRLSQSHSPFTSPALILTHRYLGLRFPLLGARVLVLGVAALRRHRLLDDRKEVREPRRDRRAALGRFLGVGSVLGRDRLAGLVARRVVGSDGGGVVFGALGVTSEEICIFYFSPEILSNIPLIWQCRLHC